ncbi:MAG: Npun_F0494 family protein [Cyanobacteria bacterium P01_F01_bin.150]
MTSPSLQSIRYPSRVLKRANRAVRCSPFTSKLFEAMQHQSVQMSAIVGATGFRNGYIRYPIPELKAESQTMWLIQIGLLRREVDGQGLTDSFRLTPLGRRMVDDWKYQRSLRSASVLDYVLNWTTQWVRWPSWL